MGHRLLLGSALLAVMWIAEVAAARRANRIVNRKSALNGTVSRVVTSTATDVAWNEPLMSDWAIDKVNLLMDRFNGDLAVMHEVQMTFEPTNQEKELPEGLTPKVAMLFLVKDSLDQERLWNNFFQGALKSKMPTPFSIYFHQYAPKIDSAQTFRNTWQTDFQAMFIPTVKTGWGQLAGAEFALLWEALRDPANAQFVFASEGTVPLKSAPYVYKYLIDEGSVARSKVCFRRSEKKFQPTTLEVRGDCIYRDPLQAVKLPLTRASTRWEGKKESKPPQPGLKGRVRKHDQWVVLARRHAVDVVENGERAMHKFLAAVLRAPQPAIADPCATGASDESFVATALLAASELEVANAPLANTLNELELYGVAQECTTFTYWRHCWKHTALSGGSAWNASRLTDYSKMLRSAKWSDRHKWADARDGLAKTLNDSPRDFGRTDSYPGTTYMKDLVNSGLLFARKFGKDENGMLSKPLSVLLPRLWQTWDNSFRGKNLTEEHRAWPSTDISDKRVKASAKERIPKIKKEKDHPLVEALRQHEEETLDMHLDASEISSSKVE